MQADFKFGVFELELQARELRKRGIRLNLPGQSLEILIMLLERPNEVLSREEICKRLWPDGTVVEFDHCVNSAVKRLRDCLGDCAATPRFVETLPKVGYRFLTQVERRDGSTTPGRTGPADASRVAAARSLARRLWIPPVPAALILAVSLLGAGVAVLLLRTHWVRAEALPEVTRLVQHRMTLAAFRTIERAERYALPTPALTRQKDALSLLPVSIHTTPPGAGIYILDYADRQERNSSRWELLGRSPLNAYQIPAGDYRIRAVKAGFEPAEWLCSVTGEGSRMIELELRDSAATPAGMVWVPGAGQSIFRNALFPVLPAELPGFWFDRHEVTNSQYKEFVDAGGYLKREYWKQPFIKNGRELSWEQAMMEFRDPSGKPGPATWALGSHPEGQADYPVSGVSWYEALAYAEYAGKSLPTVYHWFRAAGLGLGAFFPVLEFSNFSGKGTASVGAYRGLGPFGTFDMAGNVKEWCWNQAGQLRYALGGSWTDPDYQLSFPDARMPFSRDRNMGFRCAKFVSSWSQALAEPVAFVVRDRRSDKPADDAAYAIYREERSYDKVELDAAVESSDGSPPYWRREDASFRAAYGKERVVAHLFLPKNVRPPYQVVVYMPGSTALVAPTIEAFGMGLVPGDRVVRSGRALLLPAYKGTLERGPGAYYHWLGQPNRWKEMNIQWSKDLGRSLDYLETRNDIDLGRIAYLGRSMGASVAAYLLALEPRIKAAVLLSGGSFEKVSPEVDPWNFAPRVKIPVLMLNGRDDYLFPVESSQKPLFRLLGTPENHKRHVLYEGAHGIYSELIVVKDMLDWLDRYLGPVATYPQ